jgi:topoisomerase IA-like protein
VTKSYDPENVTMKDALEIIAAKIAKGPSAGFGGKTKKAAKEKEPKVKEPKETKPKPKKGKKAT